MIPTVSSIRSADFFYKKKRPILKLTLHSAALFFSGIGTIIFYIVTGGKGKIYPNLYKNDLEKLTSFFLKKTVPSYVGSSFGFIGVVVSATGYSYTPSSGRNENVDVATGGILICGLVYGLIGLVIFFVGHDWIEVVMPPGKIDI